MNVSRRQFLGSAAGAAAALGLAACSRPNSGGGGGGTGGSRELKLALEGPVGTSQELGANIFADALKSQSGGALTVATFPGAQLGGEPELLQKVRTGDIDFIISSTANASAIAAPSGVLSAHYLFPDANAVIKVVADEGVNQAYRDMAGTAVQGAKALGLFTLPLRNFYAKFPVHSIADIQGRKVRVQATATEDMIFAAYGAQTVHLAFPELYTALQTGVCDMAENAVDYYALNKHYEVAPVMSMSEHAGNCQVIWCAQKTWDGLSAQEQGWVTGAMHTVSTEQPKQAFDGQAALMKKYSAMGVQFITDVDKKGFQDISVPLQDGIAQNLGPDAQKIMAAVRKVTGVS